MSKPAGTTYAPAIHVEFAFGFGALADTTEGSWVEPSAAFPSDVIVDDIKIARGAPSEFDEFPPGTVTVQFKDRLRKLDPSNTAGTYYGKLLPRTPIRIRAAVSAVSYTRFVGYVDGWPLESGRGQSTVAVVASDAFKLFARMPLPNIYDYEVLADSPQAYWRLGEATGERAVDASPNRCDGQYVTGLQGQASVVPYGGDGSFDSTGRTVVTAVQDSYVGMAVTDESAKVGSTGTGSMSVECWIAAGSDAADYHQRQDLVSQGRGGSYGVGWALQVFPASYTVLEPAPNNGYGTVLVLSIYSPDHVYYWSVPDILDTDPHHIIVDVEVTGGVITGPFPGGAPMLHYDGAYVPLLADSTGQTNVRADSAIYVGTGAYVLENVAFRGRIDNVSLYRSSLTSAARWDDHYAAGVSPWDGDTTGARIGRVLDLIGWPADLRDLDTGEMICGPAALDGKTVLDYLQTVAQSEQGRLFMSHDGKVTFHQRDRFLTQSTETTSQYNFSDDGAGNAVVTPPTFNYDERFVYNRATVQREGGNTQIVDNTSSQATYGPISRDLSGLVLRDDRNARAIADYIVYRFASPQVRSDEWSLQPEVDADSWATLFGLRIGYRVTLEQTPADTGAQIAIDMHVQSIAEHITPQTWEFTFSGSPVDPNSASYFTWGGNDATQGWGVGLWR